MDPYLCSDDDCEYVYSSEDTYSNNDLDNQLDYSKQEYRQQSSVKSQPSGVTVIEPSFKSRFLPACYCTHEPPEKGNVAMWVKPEILNMLLDEFDIGKVTFKLTRTRKDGKTNSVVCGLANYLQEDPTCTRYDDIDGLVYLPPEIMNMITCDTHMENNILNNILTITPVSVMKCTHACFQPVSEDFYKYCKDPKRDLTELLVSSYAVLTQGDYICLTYHPPDSNDPIEVHLRVMKTEPSKTVGLYNTDISVDFMESMDNFARRIKQQAQAALEESAQHVSCESSDQSLGPLPSTSSATSSATSGAISDASSPSEVKHWSPSEQKVGRQVVPFSGGGHKIKSVANSAQSHEVSQQELQNRSRLARLKFFDK